MATLSSKVSEGFDWNEWWELSRWRATEAAIQTPTRYVMTNLVEDISFEFIGSGFLYTGPGDGAHEGTVTRVRFYSGDTLIADLKGLSILSFDFGEFVVNDDLNGLLNALFDGADTFNGNAGGDTFFGRDGGDTLKGNGGGDTLNGQNGADTLIGGLGRDALTGGPGGDKFVLNVTGATNRDTITDFVHATDKVQLENLVFSALGAAGALAATKFWTGANAHDANDRIIYNAATGALFYDADGNGTGGKVQIATLDAALALTNTDFVVI